MPSYSKKRKPSTKRPKRSTRTRSRLPGGKTRILSSKPIRFSGVKPAVVSAAEGGLLKYQNPSSYAQSLIDPFKYQDVRIPDLSTHPTGVYTVTQDIAWSYTNGSGGSQTQGQAFYVSLGALPFFQSVTLVAGGSKYAGTDLASTVRANFSQSRLVSAGLVMRYNGNDTNCSGNITCAVLSALDQVNGALSYGPIADAAAVPPVVLDCPISSLATTVAIDTAGSRNAAFWNAGVGGGGLGKVRNSYFGPVVDGCRMTYRPLDSDDFAMRSNDCKSSFPDASARGSTGNYVPYFSTVAPAPLAPLPSGLEEQKLGVLAQVPHYMVVYVSGVPSGSVPSFNISVTLNYEGIPKDDSIGIPLSGVYCNPSSQAYGLNMAANSKQCSSATTYEMSKVDKLVRSL